MYERLGNALGKSRHLPDGLKCYQAALSFAADSLQRARVLDGAGEMFQRMGKYDEALATLDDGLREVGYRRPQWLPAVLAKAGWHLALCHLRWAVRRAWTPVERAVATLAESISVRHGAIFLTKGDLARYADASARTALAALRTGTSDSIALGLGKLGFNYFALSLSFPGKWMLQEALRLAERGSDAAAVAALDGFAGASLYCMGRLAEAEAKFRASLEVLDRQGESYYRMGWHHGLRHLYSVQGRSDEELREAEIGNAIGEAAADEQTICWGQYGIAFAKARLGRLEEARRHVERALAAVEGRGSYLSESIAHHHAGFIHLQSSNYKAAADALEHSRRLIERKAVFMEYTIYAYPLLVEALVGPDWTVTRDDAELRQAHRLRWRTRFVASRFPNVYPHSMRALGRLFAARGWVRKAVGYFETAVASARSLGHEYQLARSLLDLAALDKERAEAQRCEAVALLKRRQSVVPEAEKWQLGDLPDPACLPGASVSA